MLSWFLTYHCLPRVDFWLPTLMGLLAIISKVNLRADNAQLTQCRKHICITHPYPAYMWLCQFLDNPSFAKWFLTRPKPTRTIFHNIYIYRYEYRQITNSQDNKSICIGYKLIYLTYMYVSLFLIFTIKCLIVIA